MNANPQTDPVKLFTGCLSSGDRIIGLATPLDYLIHGIYSMPKIILALDEDSAHAFSGYMLISGVKSPTPTVLEPKGEGIRLEQGTAIADVGFLFLPDGKILYSCDLWDNNRRVRLVPVFNTRGTL